MNNIINTYYTIDNKIKACRPYESTINFDIKIVQPNIDIDKQYTRKEIKKIIADLIIEDKVPEEFMFIQYNFYKKQEYKKQNNSDKVYTMSSYENIIEINNAAA